MAGWVVYQADPLLSTCEKCASTCGNCSRTTTNCTSCPEGLAFNSSSSSCSECSQQGRFLNLAVSVPTCDECSKNCFECAGTPQNCTKCGPRLTLSTSSKCEKGVSFTFVGEEYSLSNRPTPAPDILISLLIQFDELDKGEFTLPTLAALSGQLSLEVKFTGLVSQTVESIDFARKFGYVIDNIYSMFIYVTGIPNEQEYTVEVSTSAPQNVTINSTSFVLLPFSYKNATYKSKVNPGELKAAAAQGQLASAFMGQVPIKSEASGEVIGMAASADPTGVVTRFSQILKIASKLNYININYGRRLTAFLESTETFSGNIKEMSPQDLVYKTKRYRGKLSLKKTLINFSLSKLDWKIGLYLFSAFGALGCSIAMWMERPISTGILKILYYQPKFHLFVFNLVFVDFYYYGTRVALHSSPVVVEIYKDQVE